MSTCKVLHLAPPPSRAYDRCVMKAGVLISTLLFAAMPAHLVVANEAAPMFALTSSAFTSGAKIPKKYTCEGDDASPAIAWSGAPASAKSFALIVDDPDAPDPSAPKMTWVHWVVYNIPAAVAALAENASSAALPSGAVEGRNDFKRSRYGGPCPPIGRHRYYFKLYALDIVIAANAASDKASLEKAMQGHIVAHAELMGTYQKGD